MLKKIASNNNDFDAIISIIENTKGGVLRAVIAELIMYLKVETHLSQLSTQSSFGDKFIVEFLIIYLRQHLE